ncbi:hypothetical protein ACFL12_03725 [Pseudomonadota bacterium]
MFDKLKDAVKYVTKPKKDKPLSWVDDLFMQAELGKREGLTAPLFITIQEVEDLKRFQEVVIAAEEFWVYHKDDIDWMTDDHVTRFMTVMKELYDREK